MHYFYTPKLKGPQHILSEEESKHCVRVLRLSEGDNITLLNGKGGIFEAEIKTANPKACLVQITKEVNEEKKKFELHIAIAPTKLNDRFEWFLEKSTELGIDKISPIICARSERKDLKSERMEKVIVSAAKQSIKAWFPTLNAVQTFENFLKSKDLPSQKFICHCLTENLPLLKNKYLLNQDVLILIGPEGDFSESEITFAVQQGFIPVSLGKSRLRTETAGLVACHTINLLND